MKADGQNGADVRPNDAPDDALDLFPDPGHQTSDRSRTQTASDVRQGTAPSDYPYSPVSDDLSGLDHLDQPLDAIRGIGTRRLELLAKLRLKTVGDCVDNFPRLYLDRSRIVPIAEAGNVEHIETIEGRVVRHEDVKVRSSSPKVVRVVLYDGTGLVALVGFGRRAGFLKKSMKEGVTVVVSGNFKRTRRHDPPLEATTFEYEVLSDEDAELIHTGRLVPVYRLTAELPQRVMRSSMARIVREYAHYSPEVLPEAMRRKFRLIDRVEALRSVHFPESEDALNQARRRLVYEELYFLQLGVLLRRLQSAEGKEGIEFRTDGVAARQLVAELPFTLTPEQTRALEEIEVDMRASVPMNRLLQGDVGSGKTIVAAVALAHAVDSGYQAALMAPTEVLAEQHAQSLHDLLGRIGVETVLLKGDQGAETRRDAYERIADGRAQVTVGTHALIQKGVEFDNLGLVITDEQHRFGVRERQGLQRKGRMPDVLVMTATPIPRTLALTAYGDLTMTVIDKLPPGRQPIQTKRFTEKDRDHLHRFIESQLGKGRQAYVVYPLVEESEALTDIRAAVDGHATLTQRFPEWSVGLLHGRMRSDDKQDVMGRFKSGAVQILVSTTVIEVGIDVPNANVMVIENAERFGLAQLHQLRGRVGRGEYPSFCALVGWPKSEEARQRLDVLLRTTDGFEVAEEDLKIRGPGDILGTRQAGLPELTIADLVRDGPVVEAARSEALAMLDADPKLTRGAHTLIRDMVARKWKGKLRLASIG